MRVPVSYRTASLVNYKRFHKKYPEIEITIHEWRNIIYRYMELFKFSVLETGFPIRLPSGFGEFTINKRKRKIRKTNPEGKEFINLPIDWQKSKEKKKTIYIMNYHTEGCSFHWKWFKTSARMKLANYWYFKPSRLTSRLLSHYLKVDEKYQHIYCEWSKK